MAKSTKRRLDQTLVEDGLVKSLAEANALVMAGRVLVDGQRCDKPGTLLKVKQSVNVVEAEHPYVGRGGMKLEHALRHFGIEVRGATCLDLGASTGGFTDCLLQRGAAKVYAVDAGHGQLDWRLRQDHRVINMEKTNAKDLKKEHFTETIDFFCMDLSFISSKKPLEAAGGLLKDGGDWVLLIKPQFEARREEVRKGGLVLDNSVQRGICTEIFEFSKNLSLGPREIIFSPIRGAEGNQEFLLAGTKKT